MKGIIENKTQVPIIKKVFESEVTWQGTKLRCLSHLEIPDNFSERGY